MTELRTIRHVQNDITVENIVARDAHRDGVGSVAEVQLLVAQYAHQRCCALVEGSCEELGRGVSHAVVHLAVKRMRLGSCRCR